MTEGTMTSFTICDPYPGIVNDGEN